MIVLDASAALELVLHTAGGVRVAARIGTPGEELHAPHLIDLEVTQALRRLESARVVSTQRAELALADFGDLQIQRYPHAPLLGRAWELRRNVTAYDAAYIALAEALLAPLLTMDRRLARSGGHEARVELLEG